MFLVLLVIDAIIVTLVLLVIVENRGVIVIRVALVVT